MKSILLGRLLIVLAPLVVLHAWEYRRAYRERRGAELQANLEVARAVAASFAAFIDDVKREEKTVGHALVLLAPFAQQQASWYAAAVKKLYGEVTSVSWLDANGRVLASSDHRRIGGAWPDLSWLGEIARGQEFVVTNVTRPRDAADARFSIVHGAKDATGALRGIIVAVVDPNRLDRVISIRRAGCGAVSLMDGTGWLVFRRPALDLSYRERDRGKSDDTVRRALAGQEVAGVTRPTYDEGLRVVGNVPISPLGWVAGAGRSEVDALAPIRAGVWKSVFVFVLVTLLGMTLATVGARTITRPIERLRASARALGAGVLGTRAPESGPIELADLARAFNQMSDDIRERERQVASLASFPQEDPAPVMEVEESGGTHYANPAARRLFFGPQEQGSQHPWLADLAVVVADLHAGVRQVVRDVRIGDAWYQQTLSLTGEGRVRIYGTDITERKRAEEAIAQQNAILAAINRVFETALHCRTEEELGQACLAVAQDLTGSQIGFVGEIGADGLLHDIAISETGWAACAMRDQTGHRPLPGDFLIRGLYRGVAAEGEGFFTNDAGAHPDSVGVPEGHPRLSSFLGVPLRSAGKVMGMIAMANRRDGYTERELRALEALAPAVVAALERKRAELERERLMTELARQRALLEAIAENSRGPLIYLDRDFNFVWVNNAYAQVCRRAKEEFAGHNHFELYPNEENEAIFRQARDTGRAVEYREKPFVFPDMPERGVTYWDWTLTPIKNRGGEVEGLVFSLVDMTEQVHARQRVAADRRLLDTLVENTDAQLAYLDREMRFVWVNRAYERGCRRPRAELIGRNHFDLFPNAENEAAFRQVRDTGRAIQYREKPFVYADMPERGVTYWDWTLTPIENDRAEVEGMVLSLVDMTEQVQARERIAKVERERAEMAEAVATAERARAQMAEAVSAEINHRMKNNLMAVAGILQLQAAAQPPDSVASDALRDAIARIQALSVVHEQLYQEHPGTVELQYMVRRIAEIALGAMAAGNVDLAVTGDFVPVSSKVASAISMVANELTTNAVKHGGPAADGKLHIDIDVRVRGDRMHMRIWNTGKPVADDFDPADQRGMGLRLARDVVVTQLNGSFSMRPHRGGTLAEVTVACAALEVEAS